MEQLFWKKNNNLDYKLEISKSKIRTSALEFKISNKHAKNGKKNIKLMSKDKS